MFAMADLGDAIAVKWTVIQSREEDETGDETVGLSKARDWVVSMVAALSQSMGTVSSRPLKTALNALSPCESN